MEKILKYPLLFEPEGVFSMSRKGMLSMEEAARAAVIGQVARRRMPGVQQRQSGCTTRRVWRATKVATAGSGTRRPRRGNHPRSASGSTSRTSSVCREMDSFR